MFTLIAVLSLAIGVGANSTIFSAINAVLLRRPPYPNGDRLVTIVNVPRKQPGTRSAVSTADVARWRENNRFLDHIEATAWGPQANALSGAGVPERVNLQYFTPGVFSLLGVRPVLGNLPTEQEVVKQGWSVVTISYEFWQRHFGSDSRVIERSVVVDNQTMTVTAVLPRGFDLFGSEPPPEIVVLMTAGEAGALDSDRWLIGLGRLKPGIRIEQAQESMEGLARQMGRVYPDTNKGLGIKLQRLQDGLFGWSGEILYPLFAAVAFVLLIACTNIANLLLSRASIRRKELGIRGALGAHRMRLIRQLLTESVVLSLAGGFLGLLLSVWGVRLFVTLAPAWLPQTTAIRLDASVLGFSIAISVLVGILFGLAPAVRSSKTDLTDSLKEGGRDSVAGLSQRVRSMFVVIEVALALVLLVSAGLMINTVMRVMHANPGFRPNHLTTLEVRLTGEKYIDGSQSDKTGLDVITPRVGIFCREVLARIQALPGVQSAALIDWLPMIQSAERMEVDFSFARQPNVTHSERHNALVSAVSADYFHVMQIPLIRGRQLTDQDVEGNPWVVVINEAMAKKYWGRENPIGEMVTLDNRGMRGEERPREIVGVVGNVRQFRLGANAFPEIYVPYPQQARHFPPSATETRLHKSLVLQTRSDSRDFMQRVRKTVADLDKDSPVFGVRTVERIIYESTNLERFYSQLLGAFAAVALLLAAIGIYGVISYTVSERSHEFGLRIALGAQAGEVLQMVLRQGLTLSVIGATIGSAVSLGVTPLLSNFLYGVHPHDPVTLVLVSIFLIAITIVATYVPARRATKVDPMVTLRHE